MSTPHPAETAAARPAPSGELPLSRATHVSGPNVSAGFSQQREFDAEPGPLESPSERLPVPVDNLCRGVGNRGQACRNLRLEGSDYCYRHQPRPAPVGAEGPPFPELPSPEELETATGVRALVTRLLRYIAENRDADLPRVLAIRAFTGTLLRAVDVAALEDGVKQAIQEIDRLTYSRQELLTALERERSRRKTPTEEEVETLRATVYRLRQRNEELERKESGRLELQERLEATLAEQHQERQSAERALADSRERLGKVHRKLCFSCSKLVRTVLGGTPQPGDPDHVERSEYLGRNR